MAATTLVTTKMSGRKVDVFGSHKVAQFAITMGTYNTGGNAMDPRVLAGDMGVVSAVFLSPRFVASNITRRLEYDAVNKKIVAIVTSTGAEVADATDLSAVIVDVFVVGE